MVKLVQGVIQRISIKPIPNGPDRFENNFRRSFQVDDVWYSMGGCKTDKWNVKIGNDFKVLGVGSTVAFKAEQSGDFWNGKSLMVIELVEGSDAKPTQQQSSDTAKGTYTPKPRPMEGVSTGHAFNGAMNFITAYGQDNSNENIIAVAKKVHDVTERVKAEYTKANPEMSAYDSGAAAGNSVLNACKLVGTDSDFEEGVYALAMDFLNNVVPEIMAHVKGETKPSPAVKTTRAAPTKKNATKAKPVVEEEVFPELDEDDSSLPF